MKGELIIQNFINLFIIAVIIETALSAIFSSSSLREYQTNRPVKASQDIITFIVAFLLCYKIKTINIFINTGINIPSIINIVISSLILTRLSIFIRDLASRLKRD